MPANTQSGGERQTEFVEKRGKMNAVTIASGQTDTLSADASIAHDLRNPLAVIHARAEMLVCLRVSQPKICRTARNMHRASVRIFELLVEFLDRSSGAEKKLESSDLHESGTSSVDKIAVNPELQSVDTVQVVPAVRRQGRAYVGTRGERSTPGSPFFAMRQTVSSPRAYLAAAAASQPWDFSGGRCGTLYAQSACSSVT